MNTFNEILKELRKDKRLTQQQLADVFYLNKSSISRYESGSQVPEHDLLQKIADYFEVSIDYLLGRTVEQKNSTSEFKPTLTDKDQRDLDKIMHNFEKGFEGSVMLDGEILDENTKELFLASVRHAYELAKLNNKAKYTPKKYRK